ncbi:MAG: Gfo/Idh/MocA family oxidoreductase [Gammaproteobacteria bacterium]|nr:Gfo/Idh/MocA family oxidoreductase [Gammaproteobacteria bacterium]
MTNSTLKYGVIGYGYWGPNLVRAFNQASGSKVIAVADRLTSNLAKAASLYPSIATHEDTAAIIGDPAIDVVAIATPISTHFELAKAALLAGKHVVVEKPLCASAEEAARLVDLAAKMNRQILVDHTFVYTGAVQKIRSIVDNGDLGKVLYYDSTRINLGLYQRDASVIWDLVVHDLSILMRLVPTKPDAISAISVDSLGIGVPAIAYVTVFYPGNTIAHIHASWLAPVKIRRVLIGGKKSMIVYDDLDPSEKLRIYDKGVELAPDPAREYQLKVEYRVGDMRAPQIPSQEALAVMAQHANTCFTENTPPLTSGEVGLKIVRMLELADRSARENGRVLRVESW